MNGGDIRSAFGPLLDPLRRRVQSMIARAVLKLVNDDAGIQALQIKVRAGEVVDEVERFQSFGLTSRPLAGAECIVLHLSGSADLPVVIQVDDRRYRPTGLAAGDVTVYNSTGTRVDLVGGQVHLGNGATLGVARNTDPVAVNAGNLFTGIATAASALSSAGADVALLSSHAAVAGFLATAGTALATVTTGTGTITAASATIKAVN